MSDAFRVEQIGVCCVDSGQIMIVDPCYVLPNKRVESLLAEKGIHEPRDVPDYGEVCEANTGAGAQLRNSHKAPIACVTHSGYGDGVYPVFAVVDCKTGRVRSVRIEFIAKGEE